GQHTLTFRHEARKGNVHAYDSLATWNYTQVTANACQGLADIPDVCIGGVLQTQHPFAYPPDSTPVPPLGPGSNGSLVTSDHSLTGQNAIMVGANITSISSGSHDNPTCPSGNCADDYASYTITFTVGSGVSGNVMLLIGGHTAASFGPRSWG